MKGNSKQKVLAIFVKDGVFIARDREGREHPVPEWMSAGLDNTPGMVYKSHTYSYPGGAAPDGYEPVVMTPGSTVPEGALYSDLYIGSPGRWEHIPTVLVPPGRNGCDFVGLIPVKAAPTDARPPDVPFQIESTGQMPLRGFVTLIEGSRVYGHWNLGRRFAVSMQYLCDNTVKVGLNGELTPISMWDFDCMEISRDNSCNPAIVQFRCLGQLYDWAAVREACSAGLKRVRWYTSMQAYFENLPSSDRHWALNRGVVQALHGYSMEPLAGVPHIFRARPKLIEAVPDESDRRALRRLLRQ